MSELERRLRRALAGLDGPDETATRRAERAARAALTVHRRWAPRSLLAGAAAVAAVMVLAGIALAASGELTVRLGPERPRTETASGETAGGGLRLPAGAEGIAVVAGGRLWLQTRGGLGVQGLPVSAAELSPNARFAAAGIGTALVAIAADGRRAWSRPTGGRVVAAAWAPNPILIAYVVATGSRHELRVIEGNGDGDRLIDSSVAPVRPSWRADTLALAYVDAGGRARVLDRETGAIDGVEAAPAPATALAFAPAGATLAVAARGRVAIAGPAGEAVLGLGPGTPLLAWHGPDELLVADARRLVVVPVGREGPASGFVKPAQTALGTIDALAASEDLPRVLVAGGPDGRVALAPLPSRSEQPLRLGPPLLEPPPAAEVTALQLR